MKIRTAGAAALVAASVLAALAPSQAFAATQAPPCTKKNIAYLDAQDRHEDAEAKVNAAEKALDQARADRAKLDKVERTSGDLAEAFLAMRQAGSAGIRYSAAASLKLENALRAHDAVAVADAAVTVADEAQKAVDGSSRGENDDHDLYVRRTKELIAELRTDAEAARKATSAKDVEARQSDLDKERSELADAAKKVRPARDAYRNCLDKLVN